MSLANCIHGFASSQLGIVTTYGYVKFTKSFIDHVGVWMMDRATLMSLMKIYILLTNYVTSILQKKVNVSVFKVEAMFTL
jgi:hypothetical protein